MQIPEIVKTKVVRIFGTEGTAWLGKADRFLNQCIQKWDLTECHPAPELSINLVCFAESPRFGPVVLKLGVPHPELFTEIKALNLYRGGRVCQCYDFDLELGAMLLERIIPGSDLTMIINTRERIEMAADIIANLPIPVPGHHEEFPTFADWMQRAFARARRENKVGAKMIELMAVAEGYFPEINSAGRPLVLLHGDLHHKNILRDQHGGWKVIDPKGVIGPACLEAGRFILNQLEMTAPEDRVNCLNKMVEILSNRLGESQRIIALCALMDRILSTCWSFEDYAPEPEDLAKSVKGCEFMGEYVNDLIHKPKG